MKIRNHFLRQEFGAAEQILVTLQARADAQIINEPELFSSLKAFKLNDEKYSHLFDKWIQHSPKGFFAHLAKARFLFEFGWYSIGAKWSQNTPESQFKNMKRYFAKAKAA